MNVTTRYPVLLPRRHHLTRLIVEACHRKTYYGGVKETLVEVRSNFWIPKGRQYVKMVLHQCDVCKKKEGLAYSPPPTADLPESRVSGAPAFSHVGIDFAGPVYIKGTSGMKKSYICLFTCATSTAVHLELTPDLSTQAFIRNLKRFTGRCGTLVSITTDNAKTFKRANKELARLLKKKREPKISPLTRELLGRLREFHHCGTKGAQNKEVKAGDVVLIQDENQARSKWRLGEIIELIESRDGYKRGAVLRVITKKGKPSKLQRPVQKLFPLEVNTGNLPENKQTEIVQQPDQPVERSRPPRRAAAATADRIRRLIDQWTCNGLASHPRGSRALHCVLGQDTFL
ncbi:hypothetical protein ACROYT_G016624 [Oculina patagonica]